MKRNDKPKNIETAESDNAVGLKHLLGATLDLDNLDLLYALRDNAEEKYNSSENIHWQNLYSNIISDLHYLILFVERTIVNEN